MKIRTKTLVVIFLIVLVTGMTAITGSHIISRDTVKKQIYDHLETAAKSRARHIETFLDKEKKLAVQLSKSEVVEKLLTSDKGNIDYNDTLNIVNKRLKNTTEINKEIHDIMVLDKKGRIVASNIKENIGLDGTAGFMRCAYDQKGLCQYEVCSGTVITEEALLTISVSVLYDKTCNLVGALIIRFKLDNLNDITTDRTGLGDTGEIYVVNKDGYMITPSRFVTDAAAKQKMNALALKKWQKLSDEGIEGGELELYRNYNGRMVLGTHYKIQGADWHLLAEIDEQEAFAPVAKLTHTMFIILAVLLVVALVLSLHVSKALTGPVMKLHEGAEEITKGNLDYRVNTGSKDEIGQLSRAFDSMATSLKKSREKLEEHSANLETIVADRTLKLSEKVRESQEQRVQILNVAQDLRAANENLEVEIAERRQTEAELETYREHLKLINQIMRHDILNDLTAVKSALRLYGSSKDEKFLKEIMLYIDRGAETIRRMRELEALISTRKDLEPYDIEDVIKKVAENYESIEISIQGKGQVLANGAIESIIENIINNAVVHGKTDRIDITIDNKQGDFHEVRIADYGIGIPDDMKERVFEKGFRYGKTGNTGLGLYIVKKAMEGYDGIVHIEDNKPKGAVIVLRLRRIS